VIGTVLQAISVGASVYSAHQTGQQTGVMRDYVSQGMPQPGTTPPPVRHLEMLHELRSVGLLTEEEFQAKVKMIEPHLPNHQRSAAPERSSIR
jgi:hypothetical protein